MGLTQKAIDKMTKIVERNLMPGAVSDIYGKVTVVDYGQKHKVDTIATFAHVEDDWHVRFRQRRMTMLDNILKDINQQTDFQRLITVRGVTDMFETLIESYLKQGSQTEALTALVGDLRKQLEQTQNELARLTQGVNGSNPIYIPVASTTSANRIYRQPNTTPNTSHDYVDGLNYGRRIMGKWPTDDKEENGK